VLDRLCRLAVGYQDAEAERGIVRRRTGTTSERLVTDAVALTRATRERDDVRQGSSVRGAIDLALVAAQLADVRGVDLPLAPSVEPPRGLPESYTAVVLDALLLALSGRPRRAARPGWAEAPAPKRPKQLTDEPALYRPSAGGAGSRCPAGTVDAGRGRRAGAAAPRVPPTSRRSCWPWRTWLPPTARRVPWRPTPGPGRGRSPDGSPFPDPRATAVRGVGRAS